MCWDERITMRTKGELKGFLRCSEARKKIPMLDRVERNFKNDNRSCPEYSNTCSDDKFSALFRSLVNKKPADFNQLSYNKYRMLRNGYQLVFH